MHPSGPPIPNPGMSTEDMHKDSASKVLHEIIYNDEKLEIILITTGHSGKSTGWNIMQTL